MLNTVYSNRGMFVAPHHQAAMVGRDILQEGGNAIEALTVAAAWRPYKRVKTKNAPPHHN